MTTTTIAAAIQFDARVKAFTCAPMGTYRISVEDGVVRVWDSVAKAYTRCHAMSRATEARLRKMAASH